MSPKNPPAQNALPMEQTNCRHLFHSAEMTGVVEVVKALAHSIELAVIKPF